MTPNYKQIVADARRRLSPNFFSVDVKFEYNGETKFTIAMSMEKNDTIVHMHGVPEALIALEDLIEEAVRRNHFDEGRAPMLMVETVPMIEGPEAIMPLSNDCPEFDPLYQPGTLVVPTNTGN